MHGVRLCCFNRVPVAYVSLTCARETQRTSTGAEENGWNRSINYVPHTKDVIQLQHSNTLQK